VLRLIALSSLAGLLGVWVIYPVVMAALARLAARGQNVPVPIGDDPTVSLIIATRDDIETTRRRIANCLETSYDRAKLDVVVAVDRTVSGSEWGALDSVEQSVRVVTGDEPGGKAATLNATARVCRGDILVFGDVHQRWHPDAIPQLVAALADPRVGAVSGCLEIPKTEARRSLAERYWLFERWLRRSEATVHSSVGVTGAIWAMRASLWSPLPAHLILDDVFAPMRIVMRGCRVGFVSAARAEETRHHDLAQEYHRKVRTLTGVVQLCTWLPQVLSPIKNPVWLQFVVHKLLRLLTPYWVAAIGLWLAAVAVRSVAGSLSVAIAIVLGGTAARYFAKSGIMKLARETIVSFALLQAAIVVGTVNGLRGRWNVWHSERSSPAGSVTLLSAERAVAQDWAAVGTLVEP
jgi:poly-beta-1,6-N-acetyl-D-glucosamine synthase